MWKEALIGIASLAVGLYMLDLPKKGPPQAPQALVVLFLRTVPSGARVFVKKYPNGQKEHAGLTTSKGLEIKRGVGQRYTIIIQKAGYKGLSIVHTFYKNKPLKFNLVSKSSSSSSRPSLPSCSGKDAIWLRLRQSVYKKGSANRGLQAARQLLRCGVKADGKDGFGNTMLHCAAQHNNVPLIKFLLYQKRASKTIRNAAGKMPHQLATSSAAKYLLSPPTTKRE